MSSCAYRRPYRHRCSRRPAACRCVCLTIATEGHPATRVGLDHLAFAVTGRAELNEWQRRLMEAGVVHSPIASANTMDGAAVLVLRDPDNIQLELFHDPAATDPA